MGWMTAELHAAGTLETMLDETAERMRDEQATLIQQGMAPDQARATIRKMGFLPEEESE